MSLGNSGPLQRSVSQSQQLSAQLANGTNSSSSGLTHSAPSSSAASGRSSPAPPPALRNWDDDDDDDDDDGFDFESSRAAAPLSTLSSAEASFDRLMQGLTYRDRAKFCAYVAEEIARDAASAERRMPPSNMPGTPSKNPAHRLMRAVGSPLSRLSPWWRSLVDRLLLLAGLLFLQSCSSLILAHFSSFVQRHVVVTLYLTMLVGAGGNAGNQSAVLVIRWLATAGAVGAARRAGGAGGGGANSASAIFRREAEVALVLGAGMLLVGLLRVWAFEGDLSSALAIATSLYVIVTLSVLIGAGLPLVLHAAHIDPAHAGPIVQVLMDILGVAVTCGVCILMLDSGDTHGGPPPSTAAS